MFFSNDILDTNSWIPAFSYETSIGQKPLGVRIYVNIGRKLDQEENSAISRATDAIADALHKGHMRADPKEAEKGKEQTDKLIALFKQPIYVEEITNKYSNSPYNMYCPWLFVTTNIGHIEIGWRHRVIHIDWSRTKQKKTAEEMFPNENVTKSNNFIHAWGYEDAKRYLEVITQL